MFRIIATFTDEFAARTGVASVERTYSVEGYPQNSHDAALALVLDFAEASADDVSAVTIVRK